ncbi:MAG: dihydroorotate dehydrogenase electron transfer subunit [Vampirovibrionales bacterium]
MTLQTSHSSEYSQTFTPSLFDLPMQVLSNTCVGEGLWLMTLRNETYEAQSVLARFKPGQFFMLSLKDETAFQFRRPFSFWDVNPSEGTLDIYYKVAGRGTYEMTTWQEGHTTQLLAPLGHPFHALPDTMDKALLLAGGIGLAPLYFLAAYAQRHGIEGTPYCAYGARNGQSLGMQDALKSLVPSTHLSFATDDGSYGFHGHLGMLLETWDTERFHTYTHAYVCGPNPMMASMVTLLKKKAPHIQTFVSLENHMPCGTGACFGCVVASSPDASPKRACTEGPVFSADALLWTPQGPQHSFDPPLSHAADCCKP